MMQSANLLVVVGLGLVVLIVFAASPNIGEREASQPSGTAAGVEMLTEAVPELDSSTDPGAETATPNKPTFAVHIRRPAGPPVVEMNAADPLGGVAQVACSTCHSIRVPNLNNRDDTSLDEFHQGLKVNHGKLACYACHNPSDADSLRSADGVSISYQNVMTLCSQCHSPQAKSFARGAHGGMNGFWDLSRGPQTKNNCIDCHDPHAPTYPKMIVGFKPRDRFLGEQAPHDDH